MRKVLLALGFAGLVAIAAPRSASAGVHVSFGFGFPVVGGCAGPYVPPPPVYYPGAYAVPAVPVVPQPYFGAGFGFGGYHGFRHGPGYGYGRGYGRRVHGYRWR